MSRRLFTAIELPRATALGVERAMVEAAADDLPAARWVRRGGLHCTLQYLGSQSDETAQRLPHRMIEVVGNHSPIEVELGSLGAFPLRGRARVLWVGLSGPPSLARLRADLQAMLEREIGLESDERPFHPHVTVARCRGAWPRRQVERCAVHFSGLEGERFRTDHVTLFESELRADGARYRPLAELSLGGRDA